MIEFKQALLKAQRSFFDVGNYTVAYVYDNIDSWLVTDKDGNVCASVDKQTGDVLLIDKKLIPNTEPKEVTPCKNNFKLIEKKQLRVGLIRYTYELPPSFTREDVMRLGFKIIQKLPDKLYSASIEDGESYHDGGFSDTCKKVDNIEDQVQKYLYTDRKYISYIIRYKDTNIYIYIYFDNRRLIVGISNEKEGFISEIETLIRFI